MATGNIPLPMTAAVTPDASASNGAPVPTEYKGSAAAPAVFGLAYSFSATADQHLWWSDLRWPDNYASGGAVNLLWATTAVTGNVVWGARIGAITPADVDTYLEHAQAAASTVTTAVNTTEAGRVVASQVTLAALDSVAAGDLVRVVIYRDADNASDTAAAAAELLAADLAYTTT